MATVAGGREDSDLAARLGVVVVGIPLALAVIYVGGWPLGLLVALFAGIGAHEFAVLTRASDAQPFVLLTVSGAVLLVLAATRSPSWPDFAPQGFALVVALTVGALALAVWARGPEGRPLSSVSATVTGAVYAGGTLSFALLLRYLPNVDGSLPTARDGAALLFLPAIVTWVGDSAAYLAGRAWGRRKLIPRVSPGKTVVGGLAGLFGAALAAGLYAVLVWGAETPRPGLTPLNVTLIGLALGVAAQVGDLGASVLKREAGVKDSGSVFPGHGGVLDRFDALFYTIPLAYALIRMTEVFA